MHEYCIHSWPLMLAGAVLKRSVTGGRISSIFSLLSLLFYAMELGIYNEMTVLKRCEKRCKRAK